MFKLNGATKINKTYLMTISHTKEETATDGDGFSNDR